MSVKSLEILLSPQDLLSLLKLSPDSLTLKSECKVCMPLFFLAQKR